MDLDQDLNQDQGLKSSFRFPPIGKLETSTQTFYRPDPAGLDPELTRVDPSPAESGVNGSMGFLGSVLLRLVPF